MTTYIMNAYMHVMVVSKEAIHSLIVHALRGGNSFSLCAIFGVELLNGHTVAGLVMDGSVTGNAVLHFVNARHDSSNL